MTVRLRLEDHELASFQGKPRLVTVRGPVVLMRLVGRTAQGQANNPYGRFWFNERYFWKVLGFITDHHSNRELVNHYLKLVLREAFAVCHDWSSFGRIYQLRIPPRVQLPAYVGRARTQPLFSVTDPRGRGSLSQELLMGGEFQYVVDVNHVGREHVCGPLTVGPRGRA